MPSPRRQLARLRLHRAQGSFLRPGRPIRGVSSSLPAPPRRFAPALAIHPEESKDLAALRTNGWSLIDPGAGASDARQLPVLRSGFQGRVRHRQEWLRGICGWFSDRSVCYLASGRPVIAQETGFSRFLPVGAGLFAFDTIDEVLASIEALNGDYDRHARRRAPLPRSTSTPTEC